MMSDVIRKETVVFFLSIAHGIGLTALYDLLRALRRVFRHGTVAVSAEDFIFWMAAGFLTFCLAFSETNGVIRGYVAAGIAIGVILYHQTASPWVVKGLAGIFSAVRWIVEFLLRRLRRCLGFVGRIAGRFGAFLLRHLHRCLGMAGRILRRIGRLFARPIRAVRARVRGWVHSRVRRRRDTEPDMSSKSDRKRKAKAIAGRKNGSEDRQG